MRGVVYKDFCLCFKAVDKWGLLAMGAVMALFTAVGGVYAGMLISLGLGIYGGMLNLLAVEKETKVNWENYQRTLPLSGGKAVGGKYAAVLLTALLGAAGAVVSNLVFFAVYGRFAPVELELSVLMAAVTPVVWTAASLPVYYWFGGQASQCANMLPFLPLLAFLSHIGDGGAGWAPALVSMCGGAVWCVPVCVLAAAVFAASWAVSTAGYVRRR